ncbi:xanthine dehydrogenase small subunit [Nocardioides speluncae]|uniref:xanthine dehydrogenase small subunit n=1 Tax=Nocardioides speluncae TaxID=2670337 RepID=UPI000D686012|nr:FAD binding domain-containing protein [Nocardioides speluncae]
MHRRKVIVNGQSRALAACAPYTSALDWLREQGLTGAKEGCAEGECGACSVMLARPGIDAPTEWTAINSCLVPASSLSGQEVVTAEGLGTPSALHPVQREMAVRGGSQCGYCTPGFVCSMAAEYYRPGRADFDLEAIGGNLCRCTGYRPIKDAALALEQPAADDVLAGRTQEPPPELAGDLAAVLAAVAEGAVVVAGSTDLGVEINLRGARPERTVAVDQVPELREFEVTGDRVLLGAALSLTEIERRLAGRVPLLDEVFPLFASRLIRNGATIGGNLGTASPIGDLPPALLALDATVVLVSRAGEREVPLSDYFTGYRETVLRPGELIKSVHLPLPLAGTVAFHKISKRRLDDISSVAVAVALDIDGGVGGVVRRARVGLGGVAATPIRALATEAALVDQRWNDETVARAAEVLAGEGTPMDDHRASAAYRSAMLGTSLRRLLGRAQ